MRADSQKRSIAKSVIWRIVGVVVLASITYAYTGNWIQTGLITVLHHGIFLIVFYLHERFWLWIDRTLTLSIKYRPFYKMVTYETLCGNIILGLITYFITGEVKVMTQITVTYIGFKHILYIGNEYLWKRR